jgi:hypothetical protein
MKAKALRNKTTGKYIYFKFGELDDSTLIERDIPQLVGVDITSEINQLILLKFPNFDVNEFELIELEIFESGVLGADIRNKLSSIKNLLPMVSIYFLEKNEAKKLLIKGLIEKEIKQARKSLEYLSKLL